MFDQIISQIYAVANYIQIGMIVGVVLAAIYHLYVWIDTKEVFSKDYLLSTTLTNLIYRYSKQAFKTKCIGYASMRIFIPTKLTVGFMNEHTTVSWNDEELQSHNAHMLLRRFCTRHKPKAISLFLSPNKSYHYSETGTIPSFEYLYRAWDTKTRGYLYSGMWGFLNRLSEELACCRPKPGVYLADRWIYDNTSFNRAIESGEIWVLFVKADALNVSTKIVLDNHKVVYNIRSINNNTIYAEYVVDNGKDRTTHNLAIDEKSIIREFVRDPMALQDVPYFIDAATSTTAVPILVRYTPNTTIGLDAFLVIDV